MPILRGGVIMRVARLKESGKRACYHVMSRVVDRQRNKGHTINQILLLRWICFCEIMVLYSMAQVDVCLY